MTDEIETTTLLGVLEYGGLISIEAGVPHTTQRFRASMQACEAAARKRRRAAMLADLREPIALAMHELYGKYLSQDELSALVDAMLPIARAEQGEPKTKR